MHQAFRAAVAKHRRQEAISAASTVLFAGCLWATGAYYASSVERTAWHPDPLTGGPELISMLPKGDLVTLAMVTISVAVAVAVLCLAAIRRNVEHATCKNRVILLWVVAWGLIAVFCGANSEIFYSFIDKVLSACAEKECAELSKFLHWLLNIAGAFIALAATGIVAAVATVPFGIATLESKGTNAVATGVHGAETPIGKALVAQGRQLKWLLFGACVLLSSSVLLVDYARQWTVKHYQARERQLMGDFVGSMERYVQRARVLEKKRNLTIDAEDRLDATNSNAPDFEAFVKRFENASWYVSKVQGKIAEIKDAPRQPGIIGTGVPMDQVDCSGKSAQYTGTPANGDTFEAPANGDTFEAKVRHFTKSACESLKEAEAAVRSMGDPAVTNADIPRKPSFVIGPVPEIKVSPSAQASPATSAAERISAAKISPYSDLEMLMATAENIKMVQGAFFALLLVVTFAPVTVMLVRTANDRVEIGAGQGQGGVDLLLPIGQMGQYLAAFALPLVAGAGGTVVTAIVNSLPGL